MDDEIKYFVAVNPSGSYHATARPSTYGRLERALIEATCAAGDVWSRRKTSELKVAVREPCALAECRAESTTESGIVLHVEGSK